MSDLLQTGSAWLEEQRHAHMTHSVVYWRGLHSVTLNATVGRTPFEQSDSEGVLIAAEVRDYIFRAEDLVLNGSHVLPLVGDRIVETIDGSACTFELMSIGSEPCWRYSDQFQQAFRVHTKRISCFTPHS